MVTQLQSVTTVDLPVEPMLDTGHMLLLRHLRRANELIERGEFPSAEHLLEHVREAASPRSAAGRRLIGEANLLMSRLQLAAVRH